MRGSYLALAVGAIAGIAALLAWWSWSETPRSSRLRPGVDLSPDSACDLRAAPCVSVVPSGGTIAFGIQPRAIPLIEPLALSVVLAGIDATTVGVDIVGIGMNMGANHKRLKSFGEGRYSGVTSLPVCIRRAMEWEARVTVSNGVKSRTIARYRFITTH